MDWIQVLTIIGTNFALMASLVITLFLWLRKEANADRREIASSVASSVSSLKQEMKEFKEMWAQESKDFHGRLCSIEERNRKS